MSEDLAKISESPKEEPPLVSSPEVAGKSGDLAIAGQTTDLGDQGENPTENQTSSKAPSSEKAESSNVS